MLPFLKFMYNNKYLQKAASSAPQWWSDNDENRRRRRKLKDELPTLAWSTWEQTLDSKQKLQQLWHGVWRWVGNFPPFIGSFLILSHLSEQMRCATRLWNELEGGFLCTKCLLFLPLHTSLSIFFLSHLSFPTTLRFFYLFFSILSLRGSTFVILSFFSPISLCFPSSLSCHFFCQFLVFLFPIRFFLSFSHLLSLSLLPIYTHLSPFLPFLLFLSVCPSLFSSSHHRIPLQRLMKCSEHRGLHSNPFGNTCR